MATIYVTAVLEDGTPHDERLVPYNPRKPIRYTRGVTMMLFATILGRDGVPVDLSVGTPTVRLTVKQSSESDENIVSILGTIAADARTGEVTFVISASAFREWAPGIYCYDIWLDQSSTSNVVLPESPFIVEPTVRSLF